MPRPIKIKTKGLLVKRYAHQVEYVDEESIKDVVNSKTKPNGGGLYALYDDYGLYYIGLTTSSIRRRLRKHTKDHHRGKWKKFSWYHIPKVNTLLTWLLISSRPDQR